MPRSAAGQRCPAGCRAAARKLLGGSCLRLWRMGGHPPARREGLTGAGADMMGHRPVGGDRTRARVGVHSVEQSDCHVRDQKSQTCRVCWLIYLPSISTFYTAAEVHNSTVHMLATVQSSTLPTTTGRTPRGSVQGARQLLPPITGWLTGLLAHDLLEASSLAPTLLVLNTGI